MILRSFSLRSKYSNYRIKSFVINGPDMKFYQDSENTVSLFNVPNLWNSKNLRVSL